MKVEQLEGDRDDQALLCRLAALSELLVALAVLVNREELAAWAQLLTAALRLAVEASPTRKP